MLSFALDNSGLGKAERCYAALRGDGLSNEIDARLRERRLRQRCAENERERWQKISDLLLMKHDANLWQNPVVSRLAGG